MAKYHVNEAGDAGPCKAEKGQCPFGGEAQHYATPEVARQAYELSLASQVVPEAVVKEVTPKQVLVSAPEMAVIDAALRAHGPDFVKAGDMVTTTDEGPRIVNLFDPTAPYPEPHGFGRGYFPDHPLDRAHALKIWNKLSEDGHRDLVEVEGNVYHYSQSSASSAYGERARVLETRNVAYAEIMGALSSFHEMADATNRLMSTVPERPAGLPTSAEVQAWQARVNTIGEFAQSLPLNDRRARWCLEHMRPIAYRYHDELVARPTK